MTTIYELIELIEEEYDSYRQRVNTEGEKEYFWFYRPKKNKKLRHADNNKSVNE